MPTVPPASILSTLHNRGGVHELALSSLALSTNGNTTNDDALQVICAWPLSGQYGPGSRVLYYVLIASCVFAGKEEWLRGPCLAAALLFPAVAALHGIVLAALHVDGAVDMDIYGAFQLCSIGIVAAPVTVALSRTYFNIRGRNTIFLWTGLLLSGLLSLTIEFYRIKTTGCSADDDGNPISTKASQFPYNKSPTCGLVCNTVDGPFSPMREDAANNIYVIPTPTRLTFGTATLLAAACCVHALIWMASMSDKILQSNWIKRLRARDAEERIDEPIEGTNGATEVKMNRVNEVIRYWLRKVVIPVFGGAGFALLVVGEINFFSKQVRYQTEPIASVGQWAPIVGTGLAVVGSLYLLVAKDVADLKHQNKIEAGSTQHCNCSHQHHDSRDGRRMSPVRSSLVLSHSSIDARRGRSIDDIAVEDDSSSFEHTRAVRTTTIGTEASRITTADSGARRKVAETIITIGNRISSVAKDWLDDTEFTTGKAGDFPEIPGEQYRNTELQRIREQYNQPRDEDGHATPIPNESRSRAASFISVHSSYGEDGTVSRRAASPRPGHSPSSPPTAPRRPHSSSLPPGRLPTESNILTLTMSAGSSNVRPPVRSATLEVPSAVHYGHGRQGSPSSPPSPASIRFQDTIQSSHNVLARNEAGASSAKQSQSPKIPESPTSPDAT